MMKKACLAILLAMCSLIGFAKEKPGIISKEKAIKDVWYLKQTMEDVHPNLYYTISEEQFTAYLNQLIAQMDDEVNIDSLRAWLMPVVNQLNDGHTRISKSYRETRPETVSFFPVKLDLTNKTVARTNVFNIPQGAEISTINGVDLNEMLEKLLPMIDGEKGFNRLAELEYTFPYWLNRVYGAQSEFVISGMNNGQPFTQTVKGVSSSNFFTSYESEVKASFEIYGAKSERAYLKLSLFGNSQDYYRFIDDCFEKMNAQGVEQLIIDIRDNPGGNTNLAEYIHNYISPDSYSLYDSVTVKYSKLSRKQFRNYGWRKPYLLPIMVFMKPYWKRNGEQKQKDPLMPLYFKEERRYKGEVVLITSHYCYSTADDFARSFKYYQMGTVIGQETGGLKDSYGDVLHFKLPHSKIGCGCSYKYYQGLDLNDQPIDGVKPDVEVDCDNYSDKEIVELVSKVKRSTELMGGL